jgi:hypothetical protein
LNFLVKVKKSDDLGNAGGYKKQSDQRTSQKGQGVLQNREN